MFEDNEHHSDEDVGIGALFGFHCETPERQGPKEWEANPAYVGRDHYLGLKFGLDAQIGIERFNRRYHRNF